jgi:hypothetical protein
LTRTKSTTRPKIAEELAAVGLPPTSENIPQVLKTQLLKLFNNLDVAKMGRSNLRTSELIWTSLLVWNLRNDVDKSIDVINTLRGANAELVTQNADIAKTLSKQEKVILNLEKALNERHEAMSKGADGIRKNFKLLFEKYSEALG